MSDYAFDRDLRDLFHKHGWRIVGYDEAHLPERRLGKHRPPRYLLKIEAERSALERAP